MKNEAHSAAFKRAGAYADSIGMKWYLGEWPGYDPKRGHAAKNLHDITHETAHYLVSPLRLRQCPCFGLGHPGLSRTPKARVSRRYANKLETEASLLGICLFRRFGGTKTDASTIFEDHNWKDSLLSGVSPAKEVREVVQRLEAKHLLIQQDYELINWLVWETCTEELIYRVTVVRPNNVRYYLGARA